MLRRVWLVLGLGLLAACGGEGTSSGGSTVTIRVVSDYAEGREAFGIVTNLYAVGATSTTPPLRTVEKYLTLNDRLAAGVTAATIATVPSGAYLLRVSLKNQRGTTLVERPIAVEITGDATFTVHLTSLCIGAACPGAGVGGEEACFQGECVDLRCSTDDEESCPVGLFCSADEDCPASTTACMNMVCRGGVCLGETIAGACEPGEYCAHGAGCTADPAALSDGGATDGGADIDADIDAGDADVVVPVDGGAPACGQICSLPAAECWFGFVDCTASPVACAPLTARPAGSPCSAGGMCNGMGTCVPAATPDGGLDGGTTGPTCGVLCDLPSAPCSYGVTECASGDAVCTVLAPRPAGIVCGDGLVCDGAGNCGAPSDAGMVDASAPDASTCGQLCDPVGDECSYGYFDCTSGSAVCVAFVPRPAGTLCADGVCDGAGGCGAPVDASVPDAGPVCGTVCAIDGDPCYFGVLDCSGDVPACVRLAPRASGTACGDEGFACDGLGTCRPPRPEGYVVDLAAGYNHTCALLTDGAVRCWGEGGNGQLGYGDSARRDEPGEDVSLGRAAVAITAGHYFTCALLDNGRIRCWGDNSYGQFGTGDTTSYPSPGPSLNLGQPVVAIDAGAYFLCAVLEDGNVECWGMGDQGQLGDGTNGTRYAPSGTPIALSAPAVDVVAGYSFACALLSDGNVECWGQGNQGETGYGDYTQYASPGGPLDLGDETAVALEASEYHACVVTTDDTLRCWGAGGNGELGYGDYQTRPSPADDVTFGESGQDVVAGVGASVSGHHTCAILLDGTMSCFGYNQYGQLGRGDQNSVGEPGDARISFDRRPLKVVAGHGHTCVLLESQQVRCWGWGDNGQLGYNYNTQPVPSRVELGEEATALGSGTHHTCAQLASGGVECWGYNGNGQLGTPDGVNRPSPTGEPVDFAFTPARLDVAGMTTCGLTDSGEPWCAGSLQYTSGAPPFDATAAWGSEPVTSVSTSAVGSMCAVMASGEARCLGANTYGQLGFGDTRARNVAATESIPDGTGGRNADPIQISGTVVKLAAGDSNACVLKDDGTVRCWGQSGGSGMNAASPSAAAAANFGTGRTATDLSVGYRFACALVDDGSVKCWGQGNNGEIGDGSTSSRSTPTTVLLGTGRTATAIATGFFHSCAIDDQGAVRCWGQNGQGQLGDGTTTQRPTPVVPNLGTGRTAVRIAAGYYHTCAVLDDDTAKCWGQGGNGQLGDGGSSNRTSPVGVVSFPAGTKGLFAGNASTCVVTSDDNVRCWGASIANGTTSSLTSVPGTDLPLGQTVQALQALEYGYCALLADGTTACWGNNYEGSFGVGLVDTQHVVTGVGGSRLPVATLSLDNAITGIGGGPRLFCFTESGVGIHCVGRDRQGMAGYGTSDYSSTRPSIQQTFEGEPRLTGVTQIETGGEGTTCVVRDGGTVKCWGRNYNGQLGYGDTAPRYVPDLADVDVGEAVEELRLGYNFVCARLASGTVKCWGNGDYGQIGLGYTQTTLDAPLSTPIEFVDGRPAMDLAAGQYHACVVLDNGEVYCWGHNGHGECGRNPNEESTVLEPVLLPLPRAAVAVASDSLRLGTCALLDDGSVYCWGYNYHGENGNGIAYQMWVPPTTSVPGLIVED